MPALPRGWPSHAFLGSCATSGLGPMKPFVPSHPLSSPLLLPSLPPPRSDLGYNFLSGAIPEGISLLSELTSL